MKAILLLSTFTATLLVVSTASFGQNWTAYSSAVGNAHAVINAPALNGAAASDYADEPIRQHRRSQAGR